MENCPPPGAFRKAAAGEASQARPLEGDLVHAAQLERHGVALKEQKVSHHKSEALSYGIYIYIHIPMMVAYNALCSRSRAQFPKTWVSQRLRLPARGGFLGSQSFRSAVATSISVEEPRAVCDSIAKLLRWMIGSRHAL